MAAGNWDAIPEGVGLNVLHPESETEIVSPLSRKGAASGE
jgi:hypothetical protein